MVAARTTAVMKGPISRVMLAATMVPIWSCCPNLESSMPVCRDTIIPMKRPTSSTTCRLRTPAAWSCSSNQP